MSKAPGRDRRVHLFVSGRVQGVWYRGSMQREARNLGLRGWVRNLPDGRVEAVIEGKSEILNELVAWCRRGPSGARVSGVQTIEETPRGIEGFDIVH